MATLRSQIKNIKIKTLRDALLGRINPIYLDSESEYKPSKISDAVIDLIDWRSTPEG